MGDKMYSHLSKKINDLDEFCDFTFYVHGKGFKVHRVLFAGEKRKSIDD